MYRVILDLDAGIDDVFALLMLLYAEENGDLKIEAITCVRGNTTVDNVYNNVQRILKLKNKQIPVYIGANEPIISTPTYYEPLFYGKDGFGDLDYGENKNEPAKNELCNLNAVQAISEIVSKYPGEITLFCIGPMTNIALAMKISPCLADNLKEVFIMGGNYSGKQNISNENQAEFNFKCDSEAIYIVLNKTKCPITILPKEACESTIITTYWRLEVLGKIKNPVMDLLNKAETQYIENLENWNTYDPILPLIQLDPSCIEEKVRAIANIELFDPNHKGELIVKKEENNPNATIITKINEDVFKTFLYDTICSSNY